MKKSVLLIIFSLITVMLLVVSGCSDQAKKANPASDFKYKSNANGSIVITKYVGNNTEIVIPEKIDDKYVTEIGMNAFEGNTTIISIKVSDYVTKIDTEAFKECENLKEVYLPDNLEAINDRAFINCSSLEKISLPNSLINLGLQSFEKCTSLKKITIPSSVSNWKGCTFSDSGLEEIVLEEGITEIPAAAFYGTKISEIKFPESLEIIGSQAFSYCSALKKVTIPGNLTEWGNSTFSYSGLEEVTIEEGIIEIPAASFYKTKLKEIILPDSVKKIGSDACASESLEKITLNQGLTSIGNCAFQSEKMKEIIIPESVTDIRAAAFYNCSALENVIFQGNAPKDFLNFDIEEQIYEEIIIPNNFTINYNKDAEGFTSPIWNGYKTAIVGSKSEISVYKDYEYFTNSDNTVTIFGYIGTDESITIPSEINGKKVTIIGETSFSDKDYIVNVTVPNTVTKIDNAAFYHCSKLKTVVLGKNVKSIGANAFYLAEVLSDINLPDGLETIGYKAFYKCQNLKQITIPGTVKVIESSTFAHSALETVTLKEGAETIEYLAFGYNNIKNITLPRSMKTISEMAFSACPLETILLNEGLENIENFAFQFTSLTEIVIPKTVKDITEWAFDSASKLQKVKFEGDAPEAYIKDGVKDKNATYTVYYHESAEGFTSPEWNGYKTEIW